MHLTKVQTSLTKSLKLAMPTLTEQKKQIEKIVPSGTSKEKNWSLGPTKI